MPPHAPPARIARGYVPPSGSRPRTLPSVIHVAALATRADHRSREGARSAPATRNKGQGSARPPQVTNVVRRAMRGVPPRGTSSPDLPVLADCLLSRPSLRCHVYGVLKISPQQLVKSA